MSGGFGVSSDAAAAGAGAGDFLQAVSESARSAAAERICLACIRYFEGNRRVSQGLFQSGTLPE